MTITKVQLLNRGDCCGKRLKGAKVFIGDTKCGTIQDAPKGEWLSVKCKAKGAFLKVIGTKGMPLNFCGLKL